MPHDEQRLRQFETHLISYLDEDPRRLTFTDKGLTADCFRNPRCHEAFERIIGRPKDRPRDDRQLVGGTPVREWSRALVSAASSRPPFEWPKSPPPSHEEMQYEQPAEPDRKKRRKKRPCVGDRKVRRNNKRKADLKRVY